MRFLVENGANVNYQYEGIVIFKGKRIGKIDLTEMVFPKFFKSTKIFMGQTPLMFACWCGYLDIVQYLVANGADINAQDHKKMPVISWGVQNGHLAVIRYLIDKGADLNAKDKSGETVFMRACYFNQVAIARLLVEEDIDIHERYKDGRIAFWHVCEEGYFELVQLFVEQVSRNRTSPESLHYALILTVRNGHLIWL